MLVDGKLLLVKSGGFAACFGTRKGELLWDKQRIGISSQIMAQPVLGDGKIAVLAVDKELKVLATNDMGEDCIATPAIADGRLYIRTRTKLFCLGAAQ